MPVYFMRDGWKIGKTSTSRPVHQNRTQVLLAPSGLSILLGSGMQWAVQPWLWRLSQRRGCWLHSLSTAGPWMGVSCLASLFRSPHLWRWDDSTNCRLSLVLKCFQLCSSFVFPRPFQTLEQSQHHLILYLSLKKQNHLVRKINQWRHHLH